MYPVLYQDEEFHVVLISLASDALEVNPSEDIETAEINGAEEKTDLAQNELDIPEPVARSSSLSPSEDYVIISDTETQNKPKETPADQGSPACLQAT